ncbi:MAG: undecaprenyl/decaprenyl-phosphate alpha-N-acetylglucosaminyl 1-phosphate transferase, partial [Bacteroidetes bacterium]|nr:undecaprenyl/decaprenyl-phosphate alpha-N-acetylglucosaminyl 1-phosphate transferase [Bacteroidota bacterium]
PAKIFMGDSGSLMIGLINAILVLKFINVANTATAIFPMSSSVAVGFAILFVPLMDTLRVFSIRILAGRSPFTPDRNHIHHLLLDRGLGHTAVTLTCVAINAFFIVFAYMFRSWGSTYLLLSMSIMAFAGLGILYYYRKPRVRMVVASNRRMSVPENVKMASSKVVTLTKEAAVIEQ